MAYLLCIIEIPIIFDKCFCHTQKNLCFVRLSHPVPEPVLLPVEDLSQCCQSGYSTHKIKSDFYQTIYPKRITLKGYQTHIFGINITCKNTAQIMMFCFKEINQLYLTMSIKKKGKNVGTWCQGS